MDDISTLQIRVLSGQVDEATRRLHALEKGAKQAETATSGFAKGMTGTMKTVIAATTAFVSMGVVMTSIRSIVKTTAEFQQLNAQLVTATGSAEKATRAFTAIKDFAAKTPYDLQQVTSAFISLTNRGLEPSERALTSYGDIASALGRDLSDIILGVSNASNNNFEIIRNLGVQVKDMGDKVQFTFRGASETVKKSTQEIEQYFIRLGETNFAGGMERQMDTLTGAFSNLGDAWDVMKDTIGRQGLGDVVEDATRRATTAINDFTEYMESGRMAATIEAQTSQWNALGRTIEGLWVDAMKAGEQFVDDSDTQANEWEEYWNDVFTNFPANLNAALKLSMTYLEYFVKKSGELAKSASSEFKLLMGDFVRYAAAPANAAEYLKNHPEYDRQADGAINVPIPEFPAGSLGSELLAPNASAIGNSVLPDRGEISADAWLGDRIDTIIEETDALKANSQAIVENADTWANAFVGPPASAAGGDRLKEFGIKSATGSSGVSSGGGSKGGGGKSEYERLRDQLDKENQLVDAAYQRRLEIIRANTEAGSAIQAELSLSLTDQWEEQAQREIDQRKRSLDTQWQAYADEELLLEESYARRREIILAATETTEQERMALLAKAQSEYASKMAEHNAEVNAKYLGAADEFFGNLAQMGNAFGKKGFEIAKAAAIAQATIKMYESATSAYASLAGIPYIGPALGTAAAGAAIVAGAANIAAIKSQQYSGAYAHGGMIPSGQYGLVGEAGPEMVRGPAVVTSAASTRDAGTAPGKAPVTNFVVNNYAGAEIKTREERSADGKTISMIVDVVIDRVAKEVRRGGNSLSKSLEETYPIQRGQRIA